MAISMLTGKPRPVSRLPGVGPGDDAGFKVDLRSDLRAAIGGLVREIRNALVEPPKAPATAQIPLDLPDAPPVDLEAVREQVRDALRVELDQRDEALQAAIKDVAVAVASIPAPDAPGTRERPRTVYRLDVQRNFKSLVTEIKAEPARRDAPAYTFIVHRDYNDLVVWVDVKASLPHSEGTE